MLKQKKVDGIAVTLEKHGNLYLVKVDGEVYYSSPNSLFAMARYMDI